MGLENSIIEDILVELPYISDEQIAEIRQQAETAGLSLQQAVLASDLMYETDLLKAVARKLGIGWTTLPVSELNKQLMQQLDGRLAAAYRMILFDGDDHIKHVAMVNPNDAEALAFLKNYHPGQLKIYLTSESALLRALDQYDARIRQVDGSVESKISSVGTAKQALTRILEYAVNHNASAIHVEPQTSCLRVRYRIDGRLKNATKLPTYLLLTLAKEIKRLACLDIYQHKTAQHGHFRLEINSKSFLFNVSIVPTVAGQKIAIKVVNQTGEIPSLAELGFFGRNLNQLSQALAEPDGLILFCGFNHSGKTSSVYSCLELLRRGNLNIATVEESVKRQIDGINQFQLDQQVGLDFSAAINILKRQDLDVLMIDGIRARQVAELALEVVASGRLVLAGSYAATACEGIRQLLDMGLPPHLLAAKLKLVVGQRLARRLVADKAESYLPNKQELNQITTSLGITPKSRWLEIEKQVTDVATELGLAAPPQKLSFYRPKETAKTSAYKGSISLNQVLVVDQKMRQAIVADASLTKLRTTAQQTGMLPLADDGLIKASLGLTSVEEVLRVVE